MNKTDKIFLIGMDFEKIIGKYSKLNIEKNQEGSPIKKKKLRYAIELINWIKDKLKNEIYFINSALRSINFPNLSIIEFFSNHVNKV